MIIGVPKEVKQHEFRVGMTPQSVREVVRYGHQVIIEKDAGVGIGYSDQDYTGHSNVIIADSTQEVFARAELIVKVKELQPSEYQLMRPNQVLFAYLHLAPDPKQAQALLDSGCIAIAYETVTDSRGRLPLLRPASEVAGRLAMQAGAHCLQKNQGGKGILLSGVVGVERGTVVILGAGVVGTNALRFALGLGARVVVLDNSLDKLHALDREFGTRLTTLFATGSTIEEQVAAADVVIGAVLIPGASTPRLVSQQLLQKMQPGSVVVDVSIDQGGCFETSHPTTFEQPTYIIDNVVHYCVSNMPGGVPRTSTFALNNATLPFILELANKGYAKALHEDNHLRDGLNVFSGKITHEAVARALDMAYFPAEGLV